MVEVLLADIAFGQSLIALAQVAGKGCGSISVHPDVEQLDLIERGPHLFAAERRVRKKVCKRLDRLFEVDVVFPEGIVPVDDQERMSYHIPPDDIGNIDAEHIRDSVSRQDIPLESIGAAPEPERELEFQPDVVPETTSEAPPDFESQPEYVGGPPPSVPRWRRLPRLSARRIIVAAVLLVAVVGLVVGGAWLYSDSRHQLLGFRPAAGIEPESTKAFTQALHRRDPAGMRAQVTSNCVADQNSSLCFAKSDDQHFATAMANDTIEVTFLGRYEEHSGTVAVYDVAINNKTTGKKQDVVLILRLDKSGKIDHALVS